MRVGASLIDMGTGVGGPRDRSALPRGSGRRSILALRTALSLSVSAHRLPRQRTRARQSRNGVPLIAPSGLSDRRRRADDRRRQRPVSGSLCAALGLRARGRPASASIQTGSPTASSWSGSGDLRRGPVTESPRSPLEPRRARLAVLDVGQVASLEQTLALGILQGLAVLFGRNPTALGRRRACATPQRPTATRGAHGRDSPRRPARGKPKSQDVADAGVVRVGQAGNEPAR